MFTHIHTVMTMVVITVLFAVPGQQTVEPPEPAAIQIVDIDQSSFPEVNVSVSTVSSAGIPVRPMPAYTLTIADKPVAVTTETRRVPVAVAVVADLSQRMSAIGTTPFTQRFLDMKPLIGNLLSVLQALPDQHATLVAFNQDVQVLHPLTYNLGDVSNTVGQTGKQAFQPDPLPESPAQQPYPLAEAIAAGLGELERAPPEAQLVLAVFAAGDPAQQPASEPLRQQIDALAAQGRPVHVLVVGFGSDQSPAPTQLPADPAGLGMLAQQLGGTSIAIGDKPLQPADRQAINQRFAQILELGQLDVLSFDASGLPSGESALKVAAKSAQATTSVNFSQLPPRATVVLDPPSFQGPVRLSIAVQSQQADIRQVVYLLDNLPLAANPQTSGPAFEFDIDTFAQDFQRRFPPGQHELSAAVTDANGQETRTEPLAVTVVQPPEPSVGQLLASYWWMLGLGLLAVGVTGFWLVRRPTGTEQPHSASPERNSEQLVEAPTERVLPKDEPTDRVSADADDKTERIGPLPTKRLVNWAIEITGNNGARRIQHLPPNKRHFEIGRVRDVPPDIAFDDKQVSRVHARLQYDPNLDSLELVAEDSTNGTFFGEEQRQLAIGKAQPLREGDVFWITKKHKLRLLRDA